ncbi:MAG: tesB [Pseudonocardiales bacterium]|nr:tesB [Pseudonocardiales bacterium]
MAATVQELLDLLNLEYIDTDLYRGAQPRILRPRVFGGQVLAQALAAAYDTVPDERNVHSVHAYFILPGDSQRPVVYDVERLRDGGSFTTRRTAARQNGRPIFYLTSSFQTEQAGPDHQDVSPRTALEPEAYPPIAELLDGTDRESHRDKDEFGAIDVRVVGFGPDGDLDGGNYPSVSRVWMRVAGALPDDRKIHHCALAYLSDMTLLTASLVVHDLHYKNDEVQQASLDHAIWFHRPFRADDWLLYDHVSPSASGARGLSLGRIFDQKGHLVATVAQEGLLRPTRAR